MPLPTTCSSDATEVVDFLDREFDGTPGLTREFPTLLAQASGARSWVARNADGSICAHAAWRPLRLRCGSRRVLAAGIGLVTTAAADRGCGLASRLVEDCLFDARESGADLALLFAPERGLYRRCGFVPAGRERIVRLAPTTEAGDKRVREATQADAAAMLRWLEQHAVGVERSLDEMYRLLQIPDTHAWVLEESAQVRAYCVVGKGRDLQGVIHEWAGDADALAALLPEIAARAGEDTWLLGPVAVEAPVRGDFALGPVAQFRVLRPGTLGSADPREIFGDRERPARLPMYVWGLDSI